MPVADIDGIRTRYRVTGSGPPLLLLEPTGSEAHVSQRWPNRVWRGFQPVRALACDFQLIAYDRRESGQSGGRIEPLTWELMGRHAKGLLDYLGIEAAFLLGACTGCAAALSLAAHFPDRCRALFLHWPVGGFPWMMKGRENFDRHIAYARNQGLSSVVERAKQSPLFWTDPEAGPWSSVIASDPAFAESYSRQRLRDYIDIVMQSRGNLFCDAMPAGASCEQLTAIRLPAFIMAGSDAWHATSTAHMLRELVPGAKLSALMPRQQNAVTIAQWIGECAADCGVASCAIAACA
jgi:pimeloyl-ACP methyl ester carboxylesterase